MISWILFSSMAGPFWPFLIISRIGYAYLYDYLLMINYLYLSGMLGYVSANWLFFIIFGQSSLKKTIYFRFFIFLSSTCCRSHHVWDVLYFISNLHFYSIYACMLQKGRAKLLEFFFCLGFLSRIFTNPRTAAEGVGHFFNSSLPLPPTSQALSYYLEISPLHITSTQTRTRNLWKLLTTKLRALIFIVLVSRGQTMWANNLLSCHFSNIFIAIINTRP